MTQSAVSTEDDGTEAAVSTDGAVASNDDAARSDGTEVAPDGEVEDTPTLYRHTSSDAFDAEVWPDSGRVDAEGNKLYTFAGDHNPGDENGASSEWVVTEPAPESEPGEAPESSPSEEPDRVKLYVQSSGFDRLFNLPNADGSDVLRLGPEPVEVDADAAPYIINAGAANGVVVLVWREDNENSSSADNNDTNEVQA